MLRELCYELIQGTLLIITLHQCLLYLKNLFVEVYEFNPAELSIERFVTPLNNKKTGINENNSENTTPINSIIDITNNINKNNVNNNKNNVKNELLEFVNSDFTDDEEDNTDDE
jgi:hypothetical protein